MSFPPTVGRYRIDRVLGSGAFASVWLGHDDALDSQVAIKVLSGSLIDDLDVRNRFLEEARILRRADSARLVRVHDIGELPDGRPYFVMSYADRGTLSDRMRERPLPVAQAIALAEEIAYGVEVINRLGVIHRDLKPSNVLFQSTPEGGERLLIADLGLAKALAHASGAFTLPVGTPGYMSPEQARFGGGLDVRADVYGLGALTYHMLTGRPPGAPPVRAVPSSHRGELSPALDQVVMRAMEMEREKRWPTAEAFAEALSTLRPTSGPGAPAQMAAPEPLTVQDAPPQQPEPTVQDHYHPPEPSQSYRQGPGPMDRPEDALGNARYQPAQPAQPPRTVVDGERETVVDQPSRYGPPPPSRPADDLQEDRTIAVPSPSPQDMGNKTAVFPQPGPPQGPPGPGQGPMGPQAQPGPGTVKPGNKNLLPLIIAAVILSVALAGGLLLGSLLTGDDKPKPPPRPAVPKDFVQIADAGGKIKAAVPRVWPKGQEPTWTPKTVGLSDAQARPVLRATPSVAGFVGDGKSPGVFIGLTTDLSNGRLPPPNAARHSQCTKGQVENYTSPDKSLTGTITRFTGCRAGTPTVVEVGLRHSSGRFGAWVRVKENDNRNATKDILDNLRLAAP